MSPATTPLMCGQCSHIVYLPGRGGTGGTRGVAGGQIGRDEREVRGTGGPANVDRYMISGPARLGRLVAPCIVSRHKRGRRWLRLPRCAG